VVLDTTLMDAEAAFGEALAVVRRRPPSTRGERVES
jgi:hypothetical protein